MSLNSVNSSSINNYFNNAVAAPAVTAPPPAAPASNAGIDSLSEYLSNPGNFPPAEMNTAEKQQYDKLTDIDHQLSFMELQLQEINKMQQSELENEATILDLLEKLEQKLKMLQSELEIINKDNKQLAEEAKKQQERMSQVGQLKAQIDAQRDQAKFNQSLSEQHQETTAAIIAVTQ
jgi:DNA repair exonuclease SbcCD ATPase subunit